MSTVIASNLCYGTGGANNWTDGLSKASLAYNNSIVYLKFSFNESISYCDELNIKFIDIQTGLNSGSNIFNICITIFKNNDEYINLYNNSNVYPSHDNIVYRNYTTYTKNAENIYTIPTDKMINTGAGIEYIMMIGSYDNEYGTSVELSVNNTIVEGIKATRTITYDMNTGNGDPIEVTVYKGETITITDIIPEKDGNIITTNFKITGMDNYAESQSGSSITAIKKEGTFYRFLGWSNKANSIQPTYDTTSEIVMFNNITLYAIWEEYTNIIYENNLLSRLPIPSRDKIEISHKVTLDPNNGNESTEYFVGKRTEFVFKGWVNSGQDTEIIPIETEYFENITVYALWETIFTDNSSIYLPILDSEEYELDSFVVSLDANGGVLSTQESDITSKRYFNKIFNYWSKNIEGTQPVDLYFIPTDDITLYAIYLSDTYIRPIELPIATKDGHIFAGWNEEKDSGVNVAFPYIPSAHITLYAHYITKNKLKMHIYHNGKWHHIIM